MRLSVVLRFPLVVLSVAGLGAVPGSAGEVDGFAGFAWGTPRAVVADALKAQCPFALSYLTPAGYHRFVCSGYDMPTLGRVYLSLEFIDDGLRGYSVAVPEAQEAKLRATAPRVADEALLRVSGGSAPARSPHVFFDRCIPRSVCLIVRTY